MEPTLLVDAALALAICVMSAMVGRLIWRRPAAAPARTALKLFAAWWLCSGAIAGITAATRLAAALGVVDLAFHVATTYAIIPFATVALFSLLYYIGFLLTGSARFTVEIGLLYFAVYLALGYYVSWSDPIGVAVSPWSVRLEYATRPEGWRLWLAIAALIGPPVVGAAAYLRLYRHVRDATQRYRIALVAGALLASAASLVFAGEVGLSNEAWWPVASRLLGLTAALKVFFAYLPPRWMRRRFGLATVTEDAAGA